jgi:uncharacterized membrane protein YdjX (TVP38/TMEM64 family)
VVAVVNKVYLHSTLPFSFVFWFGQFLGSILESIVSIVAASIAAYFIIRYLLKRKADSLNLDKRELEV